MRLKVATAVVVLLAAVTLLTIRACKEDEPLRVTDPRVTFTDTTTGKPVTGRVHLSQPETLAGHDTVLVAMTIESQQKGNGGYAFSESEIRTAAAAISEHLHTDTASDTTLHIRNWRQRPVRWHNVFFRDLASDECWELIGQRGVVSSFATLQPITISSEDNRIVDSEPTSLLLFFVTLTDTDKDGRLTDLDARVCVVTDGDGRHPRTITPDDAHVVSSQFDRDHNLIWLQIARDSDGDDQFTGHDDVLHMMYDPASDQPATPVISKEVWSRAAKRFAEDE